MYNFLLDVSIAKKNSVIDDSLAHDIKLACDEANNSTNSERYGRKFSFLNRIDQYTVRIRLQSSTIIIPTRAISSITRALLRLNPSLDIESFKYNGSILNATLVESAEEGPEKYSNMEPHEIVQSVVEIYFGQTKRGNKDKEAAKKAADSIKEIVAKYRSSVE